MSLLTAPERPLSSGWRPLRIILVLALAVGVGYFVFTRDASDPESGDVVVARPDPLPPVAPDSEPVVRPEPVPEPVVPPAPAPGPEPAPAIAARAPEPRLRVSSDVPGADVFIDRNFAGKTPFESFDVELGSRRVSVYAPGYEGVTYYNVAIGDEVTSLDATFTVVRLDARVAVLHKHLSGSCEGELVADLDGIHYRTDGDDAFSVGLHAFDEFRVDYLKHNLRLKVRDGRTYNFTDSEPNADKLFVFHRDVEKAREKLASGGS